MTAVVVLGLSEAQTCTIMPTINILFMVWWLKGAVVIGCVLGCMHQTAVHIIQCQQLHTYKLKLTHGNYTQLVFVEMHGTILHTMIHIYL